MALSKDFVAASAEPLILSILAQDDSYGYAIIHTVRELSDGEMEWADGMLYPILHRLEKRELIESYWGRAETGRRRKYYRLCDAGREHLLVLRANWQRLERMLEQLERGSAKR
ncbi:PadR family transcriptional regulator [Haliangium ochraceum]|uniref:Transcriptional regulator, PadR-like family n=1 Tax=Haliangium ochraceum (strain DSM 14365 / JCM 11303 / SMP-2) TaxID=502025 RepID=D0LR23_HALO1|nr:helix-turn-helix transcriptional regulator [Haliangium ochraceum]ACY15531.1 transcriptional regulator, PadR-like family [Haliangium ochraceum DSM 14365]